jgi:oxygen-independent coproporphyrinogen-3 oxidase
VRFGNTDELIEYLAGAAEGELERVDRAAEIEEAWFLGLRLVEGVSLTAMRAECGDETVAAFDGVVEGLVDDGLLAREGDCVALTMRGRMLSNEVFAEFLGVRASSV